MKQWLYGLLSLFLVSTAIAQAPQGFNYQATVRNSSGALLPNQIVDFKFNIIQDAQQNTPVYTESHNVTTDDLSQINLVIGQGIPVVGNFSDISWSNGLFFLSIELNIGNGFVPMGTTQLLSVPFAMYANSAGNTTSIPSLSSVLAANNSANNIQIKNLQNPTDAQDAVTLSYLQQQIVSLQNQISALQTNVAVSLPSSTIGTQIWQSSNLEVTTYRDGTPIPQVTDATAWANLTTGAWCYYNNDPTTASTYGKLYNWYAVAGIYDAASLADPNLRKQLAPQGWHVASDSEYTSLSSFLGGDTLAGGKMKEPGTTHWNTPNIDATNSSGFSGLPGSCRTNTGSFDPLGTFCYLWTSAEYDNGSGYYRFLFYNSANSYRSFHLKNYGFSVRCIKN